MDPSQFSAAYGICPSTNSDGPQCSASDGFCFFCAFEPDPDSVGTTNDLYGSLSELVSSLASQDKEIPTIVDIVYRTYQNTVQPHIEWTNPATNIKACHPVWTRDSIRRHLLHSNQFSGIWKSAIRNMYHSLICKHNETMIDRETGMIVDDHRKAFLETVDSYRKWATTMDTRKL